MENKPIHICEEYKPANKLKDKVALITGGDSGIALHYIKEGAKVAFTYHQREKEDADKTLKELQSICESSDNAIAVEVELKGDKECEKFVDTAYNNFGSIDILVNNAAVQFPKKDFTINDGIRVNAVAPGPVWTPLIPSSFDKEKVEDFGEGDLLGAPAQPADIASAYVFLVNEIESKYFIGQVLHPNGGEIVNG